MNPRSVYTSFSIEKENCAKQEFRKNNTTILLSYEFFFLESLCIEQLHMFFNDLHKIIKEYKVKYLRKQFHGDERIHHWIPVVSAKEYIHDIIPAYDVFFSDAFSFLKHSELLLLTIDNNQNIDSFCKDLKTLNEQYKLKLYNIFEFEYYDNLVDFFCIIYNVYHSNYSKIEVDKKYNTINNQYKKQQEINFTILNSYKIEDFIKLMNSLEPKLWTDIHNFINESTTSYKKLREEHHFIYKYITKVKKDYSGNIQLGVYNTPKGNDKKREIDAIINGEIVEVTTSVYKNEFKIRKLMLHGGYFHLPLSLKTDDQIGKDLIIQQIEESINKKIDKNYSENRTLLVVTEKEFFEYYLDYDFYYEASTFVDIIKYLKSKFSNQKSFTKIYLFLDDTPYQIF